jgi:hypothetical protein
VPPRAIRAGLPRALYAALGGRKAGGAQQWTYPGGENPSKRLSRWRQFVGRGLAASSFSRSSRVRRAVAAGFGQDIETFGMGCSPIFTGAFPLSGTAVHLACWANLRCSITQVSSQQLLRKPRETALGTEISGFESPILRPPFPSKLSDGQCPTMRTN